LNSINNALSYRTITIPVTFFDHRPTHWG